MPHPIPRFERPPVIETVLGVQFAPLAALTNGHMGWFWKTRLGEEWEKAVDAVPLQPEMEVFGGLPKWILPGLQFSVGTAAPAGRLQIVNRAGDRMIQLQSSRLHYNWQKRDGAYPSYRQMRGEFEDHFRRFREFVTAAELGEITPVQWELTYVDYVPPGELWETPAEWHRVLPGLLGARPQPTGTRLETLAGEWHAEIEPRRGRLHINLNLGKPALPTNDPPGILLQTTARGAVNDAEGIDLAAGLDLGHEAVVRSFLELTSEAAQKAWGRLS
jgi:uncharacterized protein (TIGR04255 family)